MRHNMQFMGMNREILDLIADLLSSDFLKTVPLG